MIAHDTAKRNHYTDAQSFAGVLDSPRCRRRPCAGCRRRGTSPLAPSVTSDRVSGVQRCMAIGVCCRPYSVALWSDVTH